MQAQVVGQCVTALPDKLQLILEFLAKRFPDDWGKQKTSTPNISGENIFLIVVPQPCDSAEEWEKQVQQYLNSKQGNGLDDSLKLVGES